MLASPCRLGLLDGPPRNYISAQELSVQLKTETNMPIILWFLGVPLVVVLLLMLTHVI
jgi:hypothetical protein